MSKQSANVTSVEALRNFKVALQQFDSGANSGLVAFEMEARRAVDWIANDRTRYWPREEKRASDLISEARMALARAELQNSDGEQKSCIDEKKALQRAKRRQETAEEKIRTVRRWRQAIQTEVDEFLSQLYKMKNFLDTDLLRATNGLERMAAALDRYVQQSAGSTSGADEPSLPNSLPVSAQSKQESVE